MTVVITKRRKAFNVIYTIEKENGESEKKYETFYDYKQAVARILKGAFSSSIIDITALKKLSK